ncbi:dTMP kinase [Pseudomonadota bacterium]
MRGKFITMEGGEGAGKSTMMKRVARWLEAAGHRVIMTREPGGTVLAEKLREILLDRDNNALSGQAELLLVFASRAQHLDELIRPALARGDCVLCDRFTDATWAYQGGGRSLPLVDIETLESLVHGDLCPNLTLLLDLPVEQGLKRAGERSQADRFERESSAFFERVRSAYLKRAALAPDRFALIDASVGPEDVWAQIEETLVDRLSS